MVTVEHTGIMGFMDDRLIQLKPNNSDPKIRKNAAVLGSLIEDIANGLLSMYL